MGDRNNPIKFGPEWLRNLARERYAGNAAGNSQNVAGAVAAGAAPGGGGGAAGGPSTPSATSTMSNTSNTANSSSKVQLAKLRYGREEMLALYDRSSQAPSELKYIDMLYQPRGKQPLALSNSFEDDGRDNLRSSPLTGPTAPYTMFFPRGIGRGMNVSGDTRGRVRLPFLRSQAPGRGNFRHLGNPRMPGYGNTSAEDDSTTTTALRSWNNSNGGNLGGKVGTTDQAEWSENKVYRSKRTGTNTNWRQSRDDEEWRAADANRSRQPGQQDKWDREWSEKMPQERPSWNRRTWVGNETQNDDNLPEWAVDGAEACAGTFDSSGAFHGYSNDDSNLPKSPDTPYALTRSHTHGSFARSKTAEEGSEEWWASEKAKKLSPKRFDASDLKFKKSNSVIPELSSNTSSTAKSNEEMAANKGHDKAGTSSSGAAATAEHADHNSDSADDNFSKRSVRFTESKTFDALRRSDINLEEASDERSNFQSVMITPNNTLRQKHQKLEDMADQYRNMHPRLKFLMFKSMGMKHTDGDVASINALMRNTPTSDDKIVDDLVDLTLEDKENEGNTANTSASAISSTMSAAANSIPQISTPAMQLRMSSPVLTSQGLAMPHKSSITSSGPQPALQTPGLQNIGITSNTMNASLGVPLGPANNSMNQAMGLHLQGVPPPVLPSPGMGNSMGNSSVGSHVMQGAGIPGFPASGTMSGMPGSNVVNSAIFLGQNSNVPPLQSSNDHGSMPLNHGNQSNMFPMHAMQHSGSQAFNSSIYSNIMQQPKPQTPQALVDQWYYEDPKGEIQGPFASKEMYNWYRAGFFSPSLMVRRACDAHMRPLGSYGPIVPFQPMDILPSFPMTSGYESRNQGQQGLGLDVDSLWNQPSHAPDMSWVQRALNPRNETRVNNLPMFFWDQQPSAITSNSLIPEDIAKEMKTEDQILAQLRASQNINPPQNLPFLNEPPPIPTPPIIKAESVFSSEVTAAPNLEELQKLIQEDTLKDPAVMVAANLETEVLQTTTENVSNAEQFSSETSDAKPQSTQSKPVIDIKSPKQVKADSEKAAKNKENNVKSKTSKKPKEEKKEEPAESKPKEEEVTKAEKRLEETSPAKNKKEQNKKELEKEKKEWIKEGFTIVKTEKTSKDNKKKLEETKAVEEAERKRREEERLAIEEDKKRRQAEALKKQQEIQQQQHQRQVSELVTKKAPWSAVSSQSVPATSKEGLTLAEIQRLEREKKLEQMKEQQHMMQIIAQQQAAALAREQEMQAGLGWAKKKGNMNPSGQSLAEIQAEARKQAAAAAVASQSFEDMTFTQPPPINHVPWGSSHNGGGFWDTPPNQVPKPQESVKPAEPAKAKKKPVTQPTKKEVTPAAEFEIWCTTILTSWSAKIDVPTFVGFLKDIESPYEVKDYVKCYLGDSKESNDFARQFLERRSKLLRVGMVTPSDDLCSPAIAVNPRTTSGSDYQEIKSKTKKTKKSKMLKVDNRILGFSVTAAEDRINVGDIDTV